MMNYGNRWDVAGAIQPAPVCPAPFTPPQSSFHGRATISAGRIVLLVLANRLIAAGTYLKTLAEPQRGYGYSSTEVR